MKNIINCTRTHIFKKQSQVQSAQYEPMENYIILKTVSIQIKGPELSAAFT